MDYKGRKIKLALKQQLEEITFMAQTTHRSTSRVLDIFELLSTTSSDGATLTEIAQALESPKSSILPILQTLVARGYIDMDYRTNKYSIGLNLYMAASIYRSKISINKFIDNEMQRMTARLEESCCLAVLNGRHSLFLHRTDPQASVHCHKSPGKEELACLGAVGKSLLCDYKLKEISDLFLSNGQTLPNDVNLYRVHVQMEETRLTGLSYEYGEVESGIQCIATPIRYHEKVVAALGVILPIFRLTPEKVLDCTRSLPISAQCIENTLSSTTEDISEIFSLNGFRNL